MSGPLFEVHGLVKSFGAVRAVRGLDLSLAPGRITLLLGENGAGKSTAIRASLGFLRKDAGEIAVGALAIGYVPEHPSFFPWARGSELVAAAALVRGMRGEASRREVREWCGRLPFEEGLLGRRAEAYSQGNRKKLAYLQSLLGGPDLFIADEPFAALDPVSIRGLRDIFRGLAASGCAVLLSTHLISEAGKVYDDLVVVRRGEAVLRARREDLGPGADLEAVFLQAVGRAAPP